MQDNLQKDQNGWYLKSRDDSLAVIEKMRGNNFLSNEAIDVMIEETKRAFDGEGVVYLEPLGRVVDDRLRDLGLDVRIPGVQERIEMPSLDGVTTPVTNGIPLLILGAGIAYGCGYAFGRYVGSQL